MSSLDQITVGIDIGTTSVKAVAADGHGRVLARTRVSHGIESAEVGHVQHDVGKAWRRNVRRAWREVSAGLDVAAVQVSAMVPSLGAVNHRGAAAGPGLLYGDVRSGVAPGKSPAESGEYVGFLRWLAHAYPDAGGYWPAQAVANHALCGVAAIDTTTAMTTVPAFDYVGWDDAVLAEVGARQQQMPGIVVGAAPIGEFDGTLVGGGTIDAMGEQWLAGADQVGDVLVICGATLIVWVVVDEWIEVPGLWTIPHTVAGLTLVGGPSNAGGLFVDWANGLVGGRGPIASADVSIPVWQPYPAGERTPLHQPELRASLSGLDLVHGAEHIRRATYEATGFVVRRHLELVGRPTNRIVATGGGVRSAEWMRCLTDCTGLPVEIVGVPEGAALGAAFLARVTAGLEEKPEDASRWTSRSTVIQPNLNSVTETEHRYQEFRIGNDLAEQEQR